MKKSIKLLSSLICAALCIVMLSACSQSAVTTLGGSYFLSNVGNISIIGNIDETNVYSVSYAQTSLSSDVVISLVQEDGYNVYQTRITNTSYDGTDCYLLETELKTKISYNLYGEDKGTFDNYTKSKVYFLSVSNKLKPLYSETEALANSPVKNDDGTYSVSELEYKYSIKYGDTAVVNFQPVNGEFGISAGEREYKKYDKSTYYFDNVIMLFMPRAIKLSSESSLSFSSIDALSGINRTMKMTADSSSTDTELVFSESDETENAIKGTYYVNSEKLFTKEGTTYQSIPCQIVNFAVSGTFSGTPIKCWYAKYDVTGARSRLLKMETTAPYSLGTFTYTILRTTVSG